MSRALMLPSPRELVVSAVKAVRGSRVVAFMIPAWQDGQPVYPTASFETNVREGYKKNELIYACLTMKANTTASVSLKVFNKKTREEIPVHPLRQLIERPNDMMSEQDFWSFTIINRDLAGVAYWQKLRAPAGNVVALWPIRPDWLQPIQSSKGITGYKYGAPGDLNPQMLDVADVLPFKLFDPLNLYGALSPVQVAGRVADVDNAATDFIKLFWEKGANPSGVFTSKLKLTDQAVKDIQRRWENRYGGFQKWTAPAVLDSDASYQRIGLTFKEMEFDSLDARNEARICMILQVPPGVVGATVGLARNTFSNYAEGRKSWWEDHLIPDYTFLAQHMTMDIAPEFGDDVYCDWDFSRVPALQEERDTRWTRATAALTAGGITLNDFRKEVGLEDLGPAGEVRFVPINVQVVPVNETPDQTVAAPAGADDTDKRSPGMSKVIAEGKHAPIVSGQPMPHDEAVAVPEVHIGDVSRWERMYKALEEADKNG